MKFQDSHTDMHLPPALNMHFQYISWLLNHENVQINKNPTSLLAFNAIMNNVVDIYFSLLFKQHHATSGCMLPQKE